MNTILIPSVNLYIADEYIITKILLSVQLTFHCTTPVVIVFQTVPILIQPIAGEERRSMVRFVVGKIATEMPVFTVQNFLFLLNDNQTRVK